MTDLEDLWDDLPVSPAPTAQILREGRAAAGRRGRLRRAVLGRGLLRPLGSVGALAALGGAFLVGTTVGGPPSATGPGSTPPAGGGAPVATFHGELVAAESCEALLDFYVERGVALVGPYGWESPMYGGDVILDGAMAFDSSESAARSTLAAPAPASQRAENSGTGTNVQEAGVDEPDVVKTDGTTLFRLDGSTLTTYDVTGATTRRLADLDLGSLSDGEILLAGDTVVALGGDGTRDKRRYDAFGEPAPSRTTRVLSIDVSDPAAPEITQTVDVDSSLVTARQHGDTVRLVTAAGLPDLDFDEPTNRRRDLTWKETLRRNEALVRETTIADWLPTASVDGGTDERLTECEDVAVPRSDLGLDTVSVIGFDAADPAAWDVTALAADTSIAYASAERLYLAASPPEWGVCIDFCGGFGGGSGPVSEVAGTTHVFDFELTRTGTSYVGSGEVDGRVDDRWAMDEHDGVLRLALSPTQRTGDFTSVVTMRREGDRLAEVGRLDGLGKGEMLQSVRWFDGLAILVTFRQIDPFYTVDLTSPEDPTLLGELKIPGFSDYLHPLGADRLIGMGQGPTGKGRQWGAQAGLFKVSDLTDPRRLSVVSYRPGTQALAGADPRQLTWLPADRVVLTVIAQGWRGRTGWVSVLSLDDGTMTNRMVEAEHGTDIASVRLVPLPDGRVVLSTAGEAAFFTV